MNKGITSWTEIEAGLEQSTPWTIATDEKTITEKCGAFVAYATSTGKAQAICQAVNCHDELVSQAGALQFLATTPAFQGMTVAKALAEISMNGCGYDGGNALSKAKGGA